MVRQLRSHIHAARRTKFRVTDTMSITGPTQRHGDGGAMATAGGSDTRIVRWVSFCMAHRGD